MSGAHSLHVEEAGKGVPTVYLVHGFGGNGHYWRKWVPDLSRRYRTIVVDLLGFGRSPAPGEGDYSPEAQAGLLAELIRSRHDPGHPPPILIGHSLGAAVVLFAALRLAETPPTVSPDPAKRGDGSAPRTLSPGALVLMSPGVYPQRLPRYIRLLRVPVLGDLVRLGPPPRWAMAAGIRGIMAPRPDGPLRVAWPDSEMVEGYRAPLEEPQRRAAILRAARRIDLAAADRLIPRLREITPPTLVLWGTEDRIVPPALAARLSAELPSARGVALPGVGHLPVEEAPERSLEATLAFLASLAGSGPGPARVQHGSHDRRPAGPGGA